jgi:hypothetical protein
MRSRRFFNSFTVQSVIPKNVLRERPAAKTDSSSQQVLCIVLKIKVRADRMNMRGTAMRIKSSPSGPRSCSRQAAVREPSIERATIGERATMGESLRVGEMLVSDQHEAPQMAGILSAPVQVEPAGIMAESLLSPANIAGRTRKSVTRETKRKGINQFRFQPFKKCFKSNCTNLFVPGDFRPSSPRRMFCSTDCFTEHWRNQLALVFSRDMEKQKRAKPQFEEPLKREAAAGHD